MRTEPRFVKPSDFYNYWGKELKGELDLKDNESNMDNLFLLRVEEDLMSRIDKISFRKDSWDNLSEYQTECMQKAILEQADYVIRSGRIMGDGGYDMDKGFVGDPAKIQSVAISPAAKDRLVSCGLINHVIVNRRRYFNFGRF